MVAIDMLEVNDRRHTSLKEWGTSRAVRIPKVVCESTGITLESDLIMLSGTDESGPFILIRPTNSGHRNYADAPYVSIEEVFEGYSGSYVPHEADWGPDAGGEVVA